jgi:hypothetical protein
MLHHESSFRSAPTARNDLTFWHVARLRRDRPDIHARVLSGEISANAAAIEVAKTLRPIK